MQSSFELFILSNIVITLVAIIYNRFSYPSNTSKLLLSSFSLCCWVVPFIFIRGFLPQNMSLNITWLTNISTNNSLSTIQNNSPSWYEDINLLNVFISAFLFGFCLFIFRLVKHAQWIKELQQDPTKELFGYKNGYPVYVSSKVSNALLTGYTKPTIWINPKLNTTAFTDITLQHELIHIKHKDNYFVTFIEMVHCFYWWNPLVKTLSSQLKELIEQRCDFEASQKFAKGFYINKLAELITLNIPFSYSRFSSAIINKNVFKNQNSNIRRLKSFKEKQTMNLLSKVFLSVTLMTVITFLSFPISTITATASETQPKEKGVSMVFNDISIENISTLIADLLHLEMSVEPSVKHELVSISLKNIPEVDILKKLTDTLNVSFIQKDNTLVVKSLPGGVKKFIVTDPQPGDIGIALELNIVFKTKLGESINTRTVGTQIWSHFDKQFSVKVGDEYEVQFIAKDTDSDQVLVNTNVLKILADGGTESLFNPKMAIWVSKQGVMEWSNDEGDEWKIAITPQKKKYYEAKR